MLSVVLPLAITLVQMRVFYAMKDGVVVRNDRR